MNRCSNHLHAVRLSFRGPNHCASVFWLGAGWGEWRHQGMERLFCQAPAGYSFPGDNHKTLFTSSLWSLSLNTYSSFDRSSVRDSSSLRLNFSSDGVGVVRELKTQWKLKIENGSHKLDGIGVGRIVTLSFFPIPSITQCMIQRKLLLLDEWSNHKAQNRVLWLVYFSDSASDYDNLGFNRS